MLLYSLHAGSRAMKYRKRSLVFLRINILLSRPRLVRQRDSTALRYTEVLYIQRKLYNPIDALLSLANSSS